jgi:hypothetical protein
MNVAPWWRQLVERLSPLRQAQSVWYLWCTKWHYCSTSIWFNIIPPTPHILHNFNITVIRRTSGRSLKTCYWTEHYFHVVFYSLRSVMNEKMRAAILLAAWYRKLGTSTLWIGCEEISDDGPLTQIWYPHNYSIATWNLVRFSLVSRRLPNYYFQFECSKFRYSVYVLSEGTQGT